MPISNPIASTIICKLKTADQTVTNSIVMVNDTELFIAVSANDFYIVLMRLITLSSAVADFRFRITVPAAGSIVGNLVGDIGALVSAINLLTARDLTAVISGIEGSAADRELWVLAFYKGGGTGGTLQLQWCQNGAEATDTKVKTNSCLVALQIS